MNHIKRLSLALVVLGLSAPAFAADCCSSSVLVPSQHGGFKVGVDALYLRPNGSDLSYATTLTRPSDFPLGLENNASVDPSYDWGVYAQVGYLFPCTGNDLTLGYTYLNTNNTDSVVAATPAASGTGILVAPLSLFVNPPILYYSAEGKSEYTLNAVDLEAGQRFTTGAYDLRMFAGLRYANMDTTLKTATQPFPSGAGGQTAASGIQDFHSQFRGAGPRIGVDARYCLSSGFGLDADLSTSLLVGTVDSKYDSVSNSSVFGVSFSLPFASKNGSNTRVVPVLEAKLGADYTYIMDCACKSALVLEAGYQVTNYFNVSDVHSKVINSGAGGNTTPGTLMSTGNTGDVAFDGPYLGVKYYA